MSKNNSTVVVNQFESDKARAFTFLTEKGWGSEIMEVVKAMVNPETTDEEREDFTFTYTAGYVRRGFRQAARFIEKAGDQDLADVFWGLRDDIDPYTGSWFTMNSEDVA